MPLTLFLAIGGRSCTPAARFKCRLLLFTSARPTALSFHHRAHPRPICASQGKRASKSQGLKTLPVDGQRQSLEPECTSGIGEYDTEDQQHDVKINTASPHEHTAVVDARLPSRGQKPLAWTQKLSTRRRHERGLSPSTRILDVTWPRRALYTADKREKKDVAYVSARPSRQSSRSVRDRRTQTSAANGATRNKPPSLQHILARYIMTCGVAPRAKAEFAFTPEEHAVLKSQSYQRADVERWASAITAEDPRVAATVFGSAPSKLPMFVILLFLRRRRGTITMRGLRTLVQHLQERSGQQTLNWTALKTIAIRLLRHARVIWPEVIPEIAALFTSQAEKICSGKGSSGVIKLPYKLLQDLTHFCNNFLSLLALPTAQRPLLNSFHQQKAQFEVLRFMAIQDPPIVVTRTGFRGVALSQLAHPKTKQEREWAELKGDSWPPWKQNRNALDEEKGLQFGQSRASNMLRSMYDAGYRGGCWTKIIQMYAGWDVDLSPSIQTRIALSSSDVPNHGGFRSKSLLWASRVRATRTRREAWACFLAYEASEVPPSANVYVAIFEKYFYGHHNEPKKDLKNSPKVAQEDRSLLPGDKKEVWPDPTSPRDLVYLSEPMPSMQQLYRRMTSKGVKPTGRLLVLLVKETDNFPRAMEILHAVKDDAGGGINALLDASLGEDSPARQLSNQLLAAFIHFLCRFGEFTRAPLTKPIIVSSEDHQQRFKHDRFYLVEYARRLLLTLTPLYRPAWTSYMEKLLRSDLSEVVDDVGERVMLQQRILASLLAKMRTINLEPDDEQFQLICSAKFFAGRAAFEGQLSQTEATHILSAGPRELRTIFHDLVAAPDHPEEESLPPHIPDPSTLHAYVRALGMLADHEGLYSFVQWARTHNVQVIARAKQQYGGLLALRRTLVALRAALDGALDRAHVPAASDLRELVRNDVDSVREWGGWPEESEVEAYLRDGRAPGRGSLR